jgi:agmatinase
MFGPEVSFLGCARADPRNAADLSAADVVIVGAPFDSGTSYRSGARFGPFAIRCADYNPHIPVRPSLALGVDPFEALAIVDAGDVLMPPGQIEESLQRLERVVSSVAAAGAVPVILGGDHSIALADVRGVAHHWGMGRVAVVHFDAHCDTFYSEFGSLYGHGTPMRRLLECGAARGDRFFQVGLRGYWPDLPHQAWMASQGMRWYEMSEVGSRGLDACLDEVFERATTGCDGVFLSIDIDVVDPGMAPGTGTPEVGGLTSRQILDAVRRCALELPVVGMDLVEVAPAYDGPGQITAFLANRIVLEALCGIAKRTGASGRQKESRGSSPVTVRSPSDTSLAPRTELPKDPYRRCRHDSAPYRENCLAHCHSAAGRIMRFVYNWHQNP